MFTIIQRKRCKYKVGINNNKQKKLLVAQIIIIVIVFDVAIIK